MYQRCKVLLYAVVLQHANHACVPYQGKGFLEVYEHIDQFSILCLYVSLCELSPYKYLLNCTASWPETRLFFRKVSFDVMFNRRLTTSSRILLAWTIKIIVR